MNSSSGGRGRVVRERLGWSWSKHIIMCLWYSQLIEKASWWLWYTFLMPALGRQRQVCLSEFHANLVYRMSSRTTRATQRNLSQKKPMIYCHSRIMDVELEKDLCGLLANLSSKKKCELWVHWKMTSKNKAKSNWVQKPPTFGFCTYVHIYACAQICTCHT